MPTQELVPYPELWHKVQQHVERQQYHEALRLVRDAIQTGSEDNFFTVLELIIYRHQIDNREAWQDDPPDMDRAARAYEQLLEQDDYIGADDDRVIQRIRQEHRAFRQAVVNRLRPLLDEKPEVELDGLVSMARLQPLKFSIPEVEFVEGNIARYALRLRTEADEKKSSFYANPFKKLQRKIRAAHEIWEEQNLSFQFDIDDPHSRIVEAFSNVYERVYTPDELRLESARLLGDYFVQREKFLKAYTWYELAEENGWHFPDDKRDELRLHIRHQGELELTIKIEQALQAEAWQPVTEALETALTLAPASSRFRLLQADLFFLQDKITGARVIYETINKAEDVITPDLSLDDLQQVDNYLDTYSSTGSQVMLPYEMFRMESDHLRERAALGCYLIACRQQNESSADYFFDALLDSRNLSSSTRARLIEHRRQFLDNLQIEEDRTARQLADAHIKREEWQEARPYLEQLNTPTDRDRLWLVVTLLHLDVQLSAVVYLIEQLDLQQIDDLPVNHLQHLCDVFNENQYGHVTERIVHVLEARSLVTTTWLIEYRTGRQETYDAWLHTARQQKLEGKFQKAKKLLEKYLLHRPDDENALLLKASLLIEMDELG